MIKWNIFSEIKRIKQNVLNIRASPSTSMLVKRFDKIISLINVF